jgi:hypothetical protein
MSVYSPADSPSEAADQARKVVDTYRAIARWVVSSFGAVAGALVVGVQISSLGRLHGSHLVWALVSVAVLFIAILVVIGAGVRVLLPARLAYEGLAEDPKFKALRKVLAREERVPPKVVAEQLAEKAREYAAVLSDSRTAREAYISDRSSDVKKNRRDEADVVKREWDKPMMQKVWRGRTLYAKRVFKQSIAIIFVALVVAVAAATGFAYLSSMPTEEKAKPPPKVHVSVNEPKTCVALYLALDGLADDERHIGSHWPTRTLGAQDQACGFHNVKELARFLSFLAHH